MFQSELVSAQEHYVVSIHPIFDVDNFAQHTFQELSHIYVLGCEGGQGQVNKDKESQFFHLIIFAITHNVFEISNQ